MDGLLLILVPPLIAGLVAWAVAYQLTGLSIRVANSRGILARPDHRSSHLSPTPRVGGIGLVWGAIIPITIYAVFSNHIQHWQGFTDIDEIDMIAMGGLLGATAVGFLLGLIDDLLAPPALVKLFGQAVVSAIPVLTGLAVRQVQVPYGPVIDLPFIAGAAIAWFWMMLMMNAVNFMDGINGLAGRFAEVTGIALVLVGMNRSWCNEFAVIGAALWGAGAGFLPWNRPDARTFMGDCGSQALGAFAGASILLLVNNDIRLWDESLGRELFDPFLAGVILFAPFLFDTTFTLLRRLFSGRNIFEAHREHLYQRYLIAVGEDHSRTLAFVSNWLYAACIMGVLYIRLTDWWDPKWRVILFGGTAVVCCLYWLGIRKVESGRA